MPAQRQESCAASMLEAGSLTDEDMTIYPRGWAMRRGHRRRFAREEGRESCRGRAAYARSLNKHAGSRWRVSEQEVRQRRKMNQAQWQYCDDDLEHCMLFSEEEEEECEQDDAKLVCGGQWHLCCAEANPCATCDETLVVGREAMEAKTAEEETEYASAQSSSDSVNSDSWSQCSFGNRALTAEQRRSAPAWEAAQKRAEEVARTYFKSMGDELAERMETMRRRRHLAQPAQPVPPPVEPQLVPLPPRIPREQQRGYHSPDLEREHESVLAAASHACSQRWNQARVEIAKDSIEYQAVTNYFLSSLRRSDEIVGLSRLQNASVYRRFDTKEPHEETTVMFHGCRSSENEESILANGFQVCKCRSGGQNFGTWFAYNANYSDSGYVFRDRQDLCHIFICVVSRRYVVKDDATMRVVAQDCAYPLWLLRYQRVAPCPRAPAFRLPRKGQRPSYFFVVKDGKWLREDRM